VHFEFGFVDELHDGSALKNKKGDRCWPDPLICPIGER
jgi:hypothetical protein